MTGLLQIRDLVVSRGATPVVGPLTLDVRAGEIVVLVGRNGSGKSSFLAGLAGVARSEGSVVLDGRELAAQSARKRLLAGLALCPSERHLFVDLNVHDNVMLGGYTAGRAEARRRIEILKRKEHFHLLNERSGQRAGTLSGGQQQVVALARALMSRPRVLLLDEPTAGLSPEAREQVAEVVRDVVKDGEHAVIIAEENLDFACSIGTRFAAFLGGRLLFESQAGDNLTPALILTKLLDGEARSATPAGRNQ
jgi:branched-chain amino acid transport system ATP-binding protein